MKRPNGYALLDLYFPQINYAVEVDEKAHEKNITHDQMRADEVFQSIKEDYGKHIAIGRVKEGSYAEVEQDIAEVVKAIVAQAEKSAPLTWDEDWQEKEYDEQFAAIKEKSYLDIADPLGFKRVQVTNDIFGLNLSEGFLQFGKSWFMVGEHEALWFPHLTPNKKWANTINREWTEIQEKRIDGMMAELSPKHHNTNILRYTFARYKNAFGEISYRYIGNFRFTQKKEDIFYYRRDDENNRILLAIKI